MRGKLMFVSGIAVGFVLGARAGREKYNELVLNARKMWDHPTVQEAAGVVQAQANRLYHEGKDTVSDKLSNTKLGERMNRPSTTTTTDELASTPSGTGTSTSTTSANNTSTSTF